MDILATLSTLVFIVGGLFLLTYGANFLVDGSVSLAKKFRVSEAIIGLTIVAIGTSMPEFVVSVMASFQGNTEIAIGNVLGSNIVNIFFILGLTAIIAPMVLTKTTRFFDLPVVILTTILLLVLASDAWIDGASTNVISRIDGIILFSVAILYTLYSLKHNNFQPDESEEIHTVSSGWKASLLIAGGVGLLLAGANFLVDGAVDLAKMFGLSETIIGLTIVAIGTSTPELVTSIVAARRGNADIAVGNIVGSNIMNVLVILGFSAIVAPLPFLDTSYIDMVFVLAAPIALLLLALVWTKNQIGKKEGALLVLVYIAYVTYLIIREMNM